MSFIATDRWQRQINNWSILVQDHILHRCHVYTDFVSKRRGSCFEKEKRLMGHSWYLLFHLGNEDNDTFCTCSGKSERIIWVTTHKHPSERMKLHNALKQKIGRPGVGQIRVSNKTSRNLGSLTVEPKLIPLLELSKRMKIKCNNNSSNSK